MNDCLFCKIGAGEIPSDVVRETERYVAFRDIVPQAPTHILAIPREHVASLDAVEDEVLVGGLLIFVRDVARELGVTNGGYRVVLNTNADAGQTVFHIHAHLLAGRTLSWPPG